MFDADRIDFYNLLKSTLEVYGQPIPSQDAVKIWWGCLKSSELVNVRNAFAQHIKTSKFAPRPADISENLNTLTPDGRPSADEAWAMYPQDEYGSAVVSDEMHQAMYFASDLDDKVAARMAFKAAYERIVADNKRAGIKPTWSPSLGFDKNGHAAALAEAVRHGRISTGHAIGLTRPEDTAEMLGMAGKNNPVAVLPTPKNQALRDESLRKIREVINGKVARLE